MEPHYYTINVTWTSDRKGIMCSPEVITTSVNGCLEVATPPSFPKGMAGIWSPEHLYTAAVGSCLMTTFLTIAENSNLEFRSFSCEAVGKLEQIDRKYLMTEVVLKPKVVLFNNEDSDKAIRILEKSEAACLISNSITAKVVMHPEAMVELSIQNQ